MFCLVGEDAAGTRRSRRAARGARRPSFSCSRLTSWPSVIRRIASACTGRQRVLLGHAALALEHRRSPRRPAPAASIAAGRLDLHQAAASPRPASCEARMTRITSSMLACASSRPFDRVLPLPGLGQQELRAAADDRHPVPEELLEHLLERQHPRLAVDQRQEDDRERVLQRRELVELVEHDVRIGVALQLDDQPHRLLQVALVAHAGDARDPALVDQRGDPLLDAVAGLLVGDLVDRRSGAACPVSSIVVRARTTTVLRPVW